MLGSEARRATAARRALEETDLDEIRLVDLLERLTVLTHGRGKRREPHRTATELLQDRREDATIDLIEAVPIHLETLQGVGGCGLPYPVCAGDLREVPPATQQAIDDARRAAGAPGDLRGTLGSELDAEKLGGPRDD